MFSTRQEKKEEEEASCVKEMHEPAAAQVGHEWSAFLKPITGHEGFSLMC